MKQNIIQTMVLALSAIMLSYACTTTSTATQTDTQDNNVPDQVVNQTNDQDISRGDKNLSTKPEQQLNSNSVTKQEQPSEHAENKINDHKQQSNEHKQKRVESNEEYDEKKTSLTTDKLTQNNPNRFNRLLEKKMSGSSTLHDPASPSLKYLQKSSEAFADLPKAKTGNKVDWVKAIDSGQINPRHDLNDPNVKPMVMDLNIIMQVKGSMPDVVFPHRQHTQWLDCSNCHPAIFIPQSGANKMSMADNLLGQKCGVCHGKVAFPLSSCTKCHSNKKIVVKEKK
jgi:c(7)-type cytochrome triheme protein